MITKKMQEDAYISRLQTLYIVRATGLVSVEGTVMELCGKCIKEGFYRKGDEIVLAQCREELGNLTKRERQTLHRFI